MKILAIIPARSGSKGLKDKNIKLLSGKPMLTYTIDAAFKSDIFEDVIVSTDSEKYANIAREYGASVPFLRDLNLAEDDTPTKDVIKDILKKLDKSYDAFMILQPTSPLRASDDIVNAYEIFNHNLANAIISVCENEHPIEFSGTLKEDLSLENFIKETSKHKRRQDFDTTYRINGAIYLVKTSFFEKMDNFFGERSFAYIMPKQRSIDIDDNWDFIFAEALLNKKNSI